MSDTKIHIMFTWVTNGNTSFLDITNKIYSEALITAKQFGFTERKWYKPSTWNNRVTITRYFYH